MDAVTAYKGLRKKNCPYVWVSATIKVCADCGADISSRRLVRTESTEEYFARLGVTMPQPTKAKR